MNKEDKAIYDMRIKRGDKLIVSYNGNNVTAKDFYTVDLWNYLSLDLCRRPLKYDNWDERIGEDEVMKYNSFYQYKSFCLLSTIEI